MKVRIKSGECPPYLTVGKVYEVNISYLKNSESFNIACDKGGIINCNIDNCYHLNGGSWEVDQ